jgi:NAD(P)-dependent dehydrogenase (short-subunit alcohol dehydrogenase family)
LTALPQTKNASGTIQLKLQDKVAVVTGAAQGIGAACALAFSEAGASVVLADLNGEMCEKTAKDIARVTGGSTYAVELDIAEPAQARALIDQALARFGCLDVLLNNAGILATGDILAISLEDFDRVLAVNLRGAFVVAQAAARFMVKQGIHGTIINMSSVNAVIASPTQLAYGVSNGGIAQLTKAMAVGLAEYGIRVNAIGAGTIETDAVRSVMQEPAVRQMILSRTPMRRLGSPSEIANVALFLASDSASYVTGQTIYPDGGRLALNQTVPLK